MNKILSNIVSTMSFFLVYMIVYYLFTKTVDITILYTTIIFILLIVGYDLIKKDTKN